jgi:hypothetical protein
MGKRHWGEEFEMGRERIEYGCTHGMSQMGYWEQGHDIMAGWLAGV